MGGADDVRYAMLLRVCSIINQIILFRPDVRPSFSFISFLGSITSMTRSALARLTLCRCDGTRQSGRVRAARRPFHRSAAWPLSTTGLARLASCVCSPPAQNLASQPPSDIAARQLARLFVPPSLAFLPPVAAFVDEAEAGRRRTKSSGRRVGKAGGRLLDTRGGVPPPLSCVPSALHQPHECACMLHLASARGN